MRLYVLSALLTACVGTVNFTKDDMGTQVLGEPFTIEWEYVDATASLIITLGLTTNRFIGELKAFYPHIEQGSIVVTVDDIPPGDYMLFILDDRKGGDNMPITFVEAQRDDDSSASTPTASEVPETTDEPPSPGMSPAEASNARDSNGLSTGAKAGIGVGATVGGLIALTTAGLLVYRRGKVAGAARTTALEPDEAPPPPVPAGVQQQEAQELGAVEEKRTAELTGDSAQPVAELPGDPRTEI